MKKIAAFSFLILTSFYSIAQNELIFNKRFVQSEDKWIAYRPDSTGSHIFGFVYIDSQAGLTMEYQGSFVIDSQGMYVPKREIENSLKVRLENNNRIIAFIPDSKLAELKVDKIPVWLKNYKTDEHSINRLYRWGYMYNGWGECSKALEFLERAKQIDINYKGVRAELAYSYNCLDRSKEAILILQEALKIEPEDAYMNKELIYAQVKDNQLEQAIVSFTYVLKNCKDSTYNAENAYQILHGYFKRKDLEHFERWLKDYKKLLNSDERFPPIIVKMKNDMKKW